MTYLIAQFWIPILLAVALGLFIGWSACDSRNRHDGPSWLLPAAVVTALAVLVAVLQWAPGFWGLALEIALLLFAGYIAGCAIGCRLYLVRAAERGELEDAPPPSAAHH